jgi:hypothetical protein
MHSRLRSRLIGELVLDARQPTLRWGVAPHGGSPRTFTPAPRSGLRKSGGVGTAADVTRAVD